MKRTKAGFRALRERCGLSLTDVAEETGVRTRTARRWEDPGESSMPPDDAWELLEGVMAVQRKAVESCSGAVEENAAGAGREPGAVAITYYRTQAQYEEYGRDSERFGAANANARAIGARLEELGRSVEYRYPDDGAIRTPGSRY